MIRGYALVLGLLVIAAAIFAGWYGTTRVVYFAPALFERSIDCGPGWGPEPLIDEFEADWFGGELRAFDEPSLYAASLDPHARKGSVRFLWVRSFDDPIVVRVDRLADGSAHLTAQQRARGRRPESQTRRVTRRLTSDEVLQLDALLTRVALPALPAKECPRGTDGARWIVESAEPASGYVYVNRWSPRSGPIRELGLHMLGLTGWQVADVY